MHRHAAFAKCIDLHPAEIERVSRCPNDSGYSGPVVGMSFDPDQVLALREAMPKLSRGIVAQRNYDDDDWQKLTAAQRDSMLHLRHGFRTEPHISRHPFGRVPAFEHDGLAASIQGERVGRDGDRVVARLHQNWWLAGFEKALNGQVRLVRIPARGLTGGRLQWFYYGGFCARPFIARRPAPDI